MKSIKAFALRHVGWFISLGMGLTGPNVHVHMHWHGYVPHDQPRAGARGQVISSRGESSVKPWRAGGMLTAR